MCIVSVGDREGRGEMGRCEREGGDGRVRKGERWMMKRE